jgi:N-acyl-D-amino-acid deacylase
LIDVLIRGGHLVDGTGNPWRRADVAIAGDRVAAIMPPGAIPSEQAAEVVEAKDLVVCPGFVDVQSHAAVSLLVDGRAVSKITQGVTTEIVAESWSPAPFAGTLHDPINTSPHVGRLGDWPDRARAWHGIGDWLDGLVDRGVSPNVGVFVGGGTLRALGRGLGPGAATPEQTARMAGLAAEAVDEGAFGVSWALVYPPGSFASADEVTKVCSASTRRGGVAMVHLRSEAEAWLAAVDEAIGIARAADGPVEIPHLKAAGRRNAARAGEAVARIDAARAAGIDVTADLYPYLGAGALLSAVLPPWASADGDLFARLDDPSTRARIRSEVLSPNGSWQAMAELAGPEGVVPIGLRRPEHAEYVGKPLTEIAEARRQHWVDAALDLLVAERQRVATIYYLTDEPSLELFLRQPWVSIATDAPSLDPAWAEADGPVHPRAYGTYPRVLGRYGRERGVLGLEEAVRKMTSAPAARLGLRDRGVLRPGAYADVVVFDAAAVADRATFAEPHRLSCGVRHVWVNGQRVLRDGAHTGATTGAALRRGQA